MKEKDDLSKRAGMKRTGAQGRKGLMEGAFQGRKHRGTIEDDGGREKCMTSEMTAWEGREKARARAHRTDRGEEA